MKLSARNVLPATVKAVTPGSGRYRSSGRIGSGNRDGINYHQTIREQAGA